MYGRKPIYITSFPSPHIFLLLSNLIKLHKLKPSYLCDSLKGDGRQKKTTDIWIMYCMR